MAKTTILTCEYCHKTFIPKTPYSSRQRFCSHSCARRATVAQTKLPSSVDDLGHLVFRACKVCHLTKPLLSIYFTPHAKPKHGWCHTCKVCQSGQKSLYNTAHRVENNRTRQTWRKANPDKRRAETARYRAKNRTKLQAAELLRRTLHATEIRLRRMLVPLSQRRAWCRQWAKANPERIKEIRSRRRARLAHAPHIEKIDRGAIYKRDKWVCQLCFKKVNKKLRWPDPLCATLDHVIPLAKNGAHTHQNLALVHHKCNAGKRDRDIQQQMRLFG